MLEPEFDRVEIENLRFDPQNPRFIDEVSVDNEEEFLPWFAAEGDLRSVAASISSNGYFAGEPLLVAKPGVGDPDPRLIVVEGNRRFAAVRLLHDPELVPRRTVFAELAAEADLAALVRLPCAIYDARADILDYLGNRHIVGVKQWDPLAKARYLRQLKDEAISNQQDWSGQALARKIGSRADYVSRLLASLEAFDRIAEAEVVKAAEAPFSRLSTALSYASIGRYVGVDPDADDPVENVDTDHLEQVGRWLFEPVRGADGKTTTRVGDTRNLGDLAEVVSDDGARRAFEEGASLREAVRLSKAAAERFAGTVQDALTNTRAARSLLPELLDGPTAPDRTNIRDLAHQAQQLAEEADDPTSNAEAG